MRIVGSSRPAAPAASAGVRRAGGGPAFTLDAAEPAPSTPVGSSASIQGVDALLMLQGDDGPQERRRRAVRRGHAALDLLDAMKLALLSGEAPGETLRRLERVAAELPAATGDAGLDHVLGEIDLRVAVELAKHGKTMAP